MASDSVSVTSGRWFGRGYLIGILICGALNAASYFFRSEGWGNLLGTAPTHREALGFPWEVWEIGNSAGGLMVVRPWGLVLNLLSTLVIAIGCGLLVRSQQAWLTALVRDLESRMTPRKTPTWQFSLRGLLILTCLFAVLAAMIRQLAPRPEILAVVYVLGPALLVATALLPRRLVWRQRVVLLSGTALLTIAAALAVGTQLEHPLEFEKVLLGIFVCWTPQSTLAAVGLTLGILYAHRPGKLAIDSGSG